LGDQTIDLIPKKKIIKFINENLNDDQKECVDFALNSKDLVIIHGPPGTGKTSTLVEIILQLVERNKKILVVSPSNVAVDTIAERLLEFIDEDTDEILSRIGHPTRLLEQVKNIAVDTIIEKRTRIKEKIDDIYKNIKINKNNSEINRLRKSVDELKTIRAEHVNTLFNNCKIIMATIVGSGSKDLEYYLTNNKIVFDVVLIDEAAQAREVECFIPILLGKK
jgi:DNA polymerase alpha-associated DNA helicase A